MSLPAKDQVRAFWIACGLGAEAWPEAIQSYERYWDLIRAHDAEAGLMGRVSGEDFQLKHVADSLAVLAAFAGLLDAAALADVGCGAGLPGVVLAAALPRLRLTAIESNRRKASFLELAAAELGLADRVEVVPRRSRELGHDGNYRHRFDVVTARAVAPAEKLIRDCRLLIAPGGSAIFYKTPESMAAELPLARREAHKHGLTVESSEVVELPGGAGRRQFIRVIAPA